jgi:hypothetical protein
MRRNLLGIMLIIETLVFAQAPVVENVWYDQRTDGSLLVDIYYDVTSAGSLLLEVSIEASDDHGATWTLPCSSLTGDVGQGITAGTNKHVVWDFHADNPDTSGNGYRVRVTAELMIVGRTITKDFTLTEDLICPPNVYSTLTIGASDITLDLGGHTIYGQISTGGLYVQDVDRITIKNGTLVGYQGAMDLLNTDNTTVENLTIKNLDVSDPDSNIAGIVCSDCHNLMIRDCLFEFNSVHHKTAIATGNDCDFIVDNVEFIGGGVGVDFGGWFEPSNGSVLNCRFIGVYTHSILFQYSTNARVANNLFTGSANITSDSGPYHTVRNLTIEGNILQDCSIDFLGTIDSNILNNQIINNIGWSGISMEPNMGCGDPGAECFYSTGNVIRNNTVMGNEYDLYHCENCIGNTWEGNTCETKQGIEIPACQVETATALEHLISIDSVAAEIDQDAQLLAIWSWTCDTTGRSYKWYYIYQSSSQQTYYELWWRAGRIVQQDSLKWTWMLGENDLPITESWIDSDFALAIADERGGKEFRETNELATVEMFLTSSDHVTWAVRYRSQDDTVLNVYVDARDE